LPEEQIGIREAQRRGKVYAIGDISKEGFGQSARKTEIKITISWGIAILCHAPREQHDRQLLDLRGSFKIGEV
jgi:hypothetical protein